MIVCDEGKCVACGQCMAFCPREALEAWGHLHIDPEKCSDCFGGVYRFGENAPIADKQTLLSPEKTVWARLCTKYCPVGALSVEEEPSS
jgi:ferredoxin